MRKYRLLLNCSNSKLLGDFFVNARSSFICMSTSEYFDDIIAHCEMFQPEALVCIDYEEDTQILSVFKRLKEDKRFFHIPIFVITTEESCRFYESVDYYIIDTILHRPITIETITEKIVKRLEQIEEDRLRMEEEQRRQEEEQRQLEEARRIEALQKEKENERKHILVIDDDRAILKLLKAALDQNYDVTTMLNGKMAMKFLETKCPDLIFLDYQMPEENGPEVFKKIRALDIGKDIPIIFFTGVADREKIAEVMMLKPQGYLLKPIDLEKLNSTLDRIFHQKKNEA